VKAIVTLTLNPAIDGAAETERVQPLRKNRTSNERYYPGGGGINVARVIEELGGKATAVYLSGGVPGPLFDTLFERTGIAAHHVRIEDNTRFSHVIFERSTGLEYRFVPEGPRIQEREWRSSLEVLDTLEFDFLVASGSLPPGVPSDFYATVADLVARKGARLVLDTSGAPLQRALERGVFMIKPSLGEFEALIGKSISDPLTAENEAQALVRSGAAQVIALTMGRAGALLASNEARLKLAPPPVEAKSAVGAGDSFVGAMTLALAQGRGIQDSFGFGVAAGTAAVLSVGTELCKRADVERLHAVLKSHGPGADKSRSSPTA
jgi:6-phosphofructokinase 2